MWVSMQVTLILGYFIFLLYAFVVVTLFRYLCSMNKPIPWIHKKLVRMQPFLSALAYYHDQKFEAPAPEPDQRTDLDKCAICVAEYQEADEIAELNCK